MNGGAAVAPAQAEDPEVRIGRPIAYQSSKRKKDNSEPLEIPFGERRWCVVGYSKRTSHEPAMISEEFTRIHRSEPHFRDVDGACQLQWVIRKVREGFQSLTRTSPPSCR